MISFQCRVLSPDNDLIAKPDNYVKSALRF